MKKFIASLVVSSLVLLSMGATRKIPMMQMGGYANRIFLYDSQAANTLSLWLFENVATDETGNDDLIAEATGDAAVYGGTSPPDGDYYFVTSRSDINNCLHTDGNITGTVQTLEFRCFIPTGATSNVRILDGDGAGNWNNIQLVSETLVFNFGNIYAWHTEVHNNDQWYQYGITYNSTNIEIFQGNVSQKDAANTYQSVNKTWHFGNNGAHNSASDIYLDEIRISSNVRTVFPTRD